MQSTAILASLALLFGVQTQVAPHQPSGNARVPGIVERPGSPRMPGNIEVRGNPGNSSDSTYRRDLREVSKDIDRRRKNGELTRREARELRRAAARIGNLADRHHARGGQDGRSHDTPQLEI